MPVPAHAECQWVGGADVVVTLRSVVYIFMSVCGCMCERMYVYIGGCMCVCVCVFGGLHLHFLDLFTRVALHVSPGNWNYLLHFLIFYCCCCCGCYCCVGFYWAVDSDGDGDVDGAASAAAACFCYFYHIWANRVVEMFACCGFTWACWEKKMQTKCRARCGSDSFRRLTFLWYLVFRFLFFFTQHSRRTRPRWKQYSGIITVLPTQPFPVRFLITYDILVFYSVTLDCVFVLEASAANGSLWLEAIIFACHSV